MLPFVDLEYVRRSISIRDVVKRLGLEVAGSMVRCWRPENHQNGDRTPSVGLYTKQNAARCFVCDPIRLSTIDVVRSVLKKDLMGAIQWFTSHYIVPEAPKGKHLPKVHALEHPFCIRGDWSPMELLIRTGLWAAFTPGQKAIFPVLAIFADANSESATISYRALMRLTNIRSHSTVSRALKRFEAIHLLQRTRKREQTGLRSCGSYKLCVENPEFQELARNCYETRIAQSREERELRQKERRRRALELQQYYR